MRAVLCQGLSPETSPLYGLSEVRLFITVLYERFRGGSSDVHVTWAWEHGFRSPQVTFSSMEAVI